jgi:hypothetical protein
MQDLCNNIKVVRAISPTRVTDNTAQTSQAVDGANFDSVTFVLAVGSLADADMTLAVEVQECDTSGGSYTAVADADLIGTETGAALTFSDDNEQVKIGYIGKKRYTKLVVTPSGNSGNADLCAVAILGHARNMPLSTQGT